MFTVLLTGAMIAVLVIFVIVVLAILRAAALPTPRPESGSEDRSPSETK
jgi:hypothetical protein